MVSAKKKRVSKKKKIAWRKHVDVKDVEEFLEDKRADERLGGGIEVLPDADLFVVDTKPLTKAQIESKDKRKRLAESEPRCFQALENLTKIPDPIAKRNRVRTKEERKSQIVKNKEESNKLKGIVKAKDKIAAQYRKFNKAKQEADKFKVGEFKIDLWKTEAINSIEELKNEWYESDTVRHNHQGLGKLRKHTPRSLAKKKSLHPNIEAPHPGMSYNPSFKDHQALLKEIVDKEEKIIKENEHLERVTTRMFKRVTQDKKQDSWMTEMSQGLPVAENKDNHDSESDSEYKTINPPVKNSKKDRKQRRKQKEQRNLEQARKIAKSEKKKLTDIYKLKSMKKQITKKKLEEKKQQEKREKLKKLKELEPKRIGTQKYEEPDLEFNMAEDLSGSLRNVKSEGNLLRDRFKSMQKRNILQPTVQQTRKRGKIKKFEKATHKMGWESKGY